MNNSKKTVAILGAAGAIGQHIVVGMQSRDWNVRAITRRTNERTFPAGVQIVPGDLEEPKSLQKAFHGADSLVLIAYPYTVKAVLKEAKQAGIRHIVVNSSAAVTAGYDTTWNYLVEQAVQESGIGWTIARPGEFMTNAREIWGPAIRHERRAVEPYPDQVGSPIHERDVADLIIAGLTDPSRIGRIDTIVGPEALTKRRQIEIIGETLGEKIRIDQVTSEEARTFYKAQGGFAGENADFLFGFESYDRVEGEVNEPHDSSVDKRDPAYQILDQILGQPARTFAQWAREHVADFRA